MLPEYPRPQLVRERWLNLNGAWEYAVRDSGTAAPDRYDGTILVPFAIESQLSGVERRVGEREWLWHRRTFHAPRLERGGRLLLHFGAVDWEAAVYVNGREVGQHRGGYDPFSFDITDALRSESDQELIVRVWDPTDRGSQPRGKQVQQPGGIMYTPVTGIWQTVWLEPVPAAYIARLRLTPDVDDGAVTVHVEAGGSATGSERIRVTVLAGNRTVARAQGHVTEPLVIRVPDARLWSPDDPYLYDLRVTLGKSESVTSYFGMRKIAVAQDSAGRPRLFLNNQPLFQYGPLDQGWWPEGLYTAPTDEALRWDIEATKRLGFNMIRKHVKVEPARWYYHADRVGMLVWQDMPSMSNDPPPAARQQFERELRNMVDAFRHFPSIVMWVPFNEGWGQHDTERYTTLIKEVDSTRLVNSASGWADAGVGDVVDAHVYPGPGMPMPDPSRASVLGEFGGLGLPLPGHTWLSEGSWSYRSFESRAALDGAYRDLMRDLRLLIADGLAAAVYTQTTDVETEVNGLITYDRAVVKISPQAIDEHAAMYGPLPARRTIVPTSFHTGQAWRFTTTEPDPTWTQPDYDDSDWEEGVGGFGLPIPSGYAMSPVPARTDHGAPSIWLRQTFELTTTELVSPQWRIYHSGEVNVYLNGQRVGHFPGGTNTYAGVPFSATARDALQAGTNTIAAHMRMPPEQWQFIDLGIEDLPPEYVMRDENQVSQEDTRDRDPATSATSGPPGESSKVVGELTLDFTSPGGTIKDGGGLATGFTMRLPGSGTNLSENDGNLALDTAAGVLNLTTTTADFNGQVNMADLQAVGISLSSLNFAGGEDFSVSATFVDVPDNALMDQPDQLGVFVGRSTTSVIRAGLINADRVAPPGTTRSNMAFAVLTNGADDSHSRWLGPPGSADVGETMVVEIGRRGGTWSVLVNGMDAMPNTETDGTGTRTPPTFLDGEADLVVGVFALDLNGIHKKLQIDRFLARVFEP